MLFGPGTASGTFDFFTEHVVGKARASRGDYTPSEDDNVLVVGISQTKGALGYFGLAYYLHNMDKLKPVKIWNDSLKEYVTPTVENAIKGIYPLTRPLFIYVNKNLLKTENTLKFVKFYLENCDRFAKEAGYVPINEENKRTNLDKLMKTIQ